MAGLATCGEELCCADLSLEHECDDKLATSAYLGDRLLPGLLLRSQASACLSREAAAPQLPLTSFKSFRQPGLLLLHAAVLKP